MSKSIQTREEYYQSSEFKLLRLLHNYPHKIVHTTQDIRDVLEVIADQRQLLASDKLCIVERQLRVVNLEAHNLIRAIDNLRSILEPHSFADPNEPKDSK